MGPDLYFHIRINLYWQPGSLLTPYEFSELKFDELRFRIEWWNIYQSYITRSIKNDGNFEKEMLITGLAFLGFFL